MKLSKPITTNNTMKLEKPIDNTPANNAECKHNQKEMIDIGNRTYCQVCQKYVNTNKTS